MRTIGTLSNPGVVVAPTCCRRGLQMFGLRPFGPKPT
jgi:hypothetical protein